MICVAATPVRHPSKTTIPETGVATPPVQQAPLPPPELEHTPRVRRRSAISLYWVQTSTRRSSGSDTRWLCRRAECGSQKGPMRAASAQWSRCPA
eukprot:s6344_g3.t1